LISSINLDFVNFYFDEFCREFLQNPKLLIFQRLKSLK